MHFAHLLYFISLAIAIWPIPQFYTHGNASLWIDENIKINYVVGQSVRDFSWSSQITRPRYAEYPLQNYDSASSDWDYKQRLLNHTNSVFLAPLSIIENAIQRALKTIFEDSIVPWKFYPRGTLFEPASNDTKRFLNHLEIVQFNGNDSIVAAAGDIDESYSITVTDSGFAKIMAPSYLGVLHALQTFTQLFCQHSTSSGIYTPLVPISIKDRPRFAHRGLNLDISRNFYPVDDIYRVIDALAWNKFNRFHIHITDAQSWPLEIPSIPSLSARGAYHPSLVYTPTDLASIQQYAILRGIQPILEIDMPGHTSSIHHSFPELITAFNARPYNTYCAEPPCGSLKLNSTLVYDFLDTLFSDILPRISPYTSNFHTGGDEVNVNSYLLDSTVLSNSTQTLTPLMQAFIDFNHARVRAAGLTPIVWEEMLLEWNLTLGSDVVIQTWQSDDALANITAVGHKALFGNYNFWYLDCGKGAWLNTPNNSSSFHASYPLFADYCAPYKNWRQIYVYDPTAGLSDAQKVLVVGGEIHLWSEQMDGVGVDGALWPRAAAAGEVMWSGRQDLAGMNRSLVDAAGRLSVWRERLVKRGIRAELIQMAFCTMEGDEACLG